MTDLELSGRHDFLHNFTSEKWEEIGRDISNNTRLERILFTAHALSDEEMSFFFRGLTRSSSIRTLIFDDHSAIGPDVIRSMMPFLQNARSLIRLNIGCTM